MSTGYDCVLLKLYLNLGLFLFYTPCITNVRLSKHAAKSEEANSKQQVRLETDRMSNKHKRWNETDSEQQIKLEKDRQSKNKSKQENCHSLHMRL